jgi:2-phosphosulfolactate phosphatase
MCELRVHYLPKNVAADELAGSTVVVIDLLRASTTICQALAAGATEVVPFLEVEEALEAAAADRANVVLGGERGGRRIEGFDLGNSPSEYTPATVGGRRVFITTTNGTRALHHARQAERVIVGAFVNLSAVAESLQNAPRVDILCAGTDGRESREDILAAGVLVDKLAARDSTAWKLNAAAEAALAEWQSRGEDLSVELRATPGGENLLAIGHDHDLVDCAQIDALAIVPELDVSTGRITLP